MSSKSSIVSQEMSAPSHAGRSAVQGEVCAMCGSANLNLKTKQDIGWSDAIDWRVNGHRVCYRCFWNASAERVRVERSSGVDFRQPKAA